jgi:CDP-paratose 2-epimerase
MRVLITGGAGFVGSSLARLFKEHVSSSHVVVFDNLKRRGSELNLPDFKRMGIDFFHGDIRNPFDLDDLTGQFDLCVEASAEPSVHAGTDGQSPVYLLQTNLVGTLNCLEFARRRSRGMIFLSTSRVYAIAALKTIPLQELTTRFEVAADVAQPGLSVLGIREEFPVVGRGFRSLYGSTKLASELFIEEYGENFGLPAIINRCGVIAGAGQFGKTDQGVFTLWVARHLFGRELQYTGFGGTGKQVRDLLHPADLFRLVVLESERLESLQGRLYVVGGGRTNSVSLQEYTNICRRVTGSTVVVLPSPKTTAVDVPWLVMDHTKVTTELGWSPLMSPVDIVEDIASWLKAHRLAVQTLFL